MTYGQPSGTTNWNPSLGDLGLDICERVGLLDIQSKHMFSLRRSMNLRLQHWGVLGINLWRVDKTPYAITMVPGQAVYNLPSDVVSLLDTYRRTPGATTTAVATDASDTVTINWPAHGLSAGSTVPFIDPFDVGGLTIAGIYTVVTAPTTNQFTITAASAATSDETVTINAQAGGPAVADIFMSPQSRTDYASQANKATLGPPSLYWFQKLISPQLAVWPTPDAAQPYQIQTYLCRQIQDADMAGGQTPDLPQRFWYAFVADVAADMAIKWARDRLAALQAEAIRAFREASDDDVERVPTYFMPQFPSPC